METSLAEREAMIRIFQTNKTVNNSNDILNKALVSGGVPGTATSSQGAAAAASGQLAAAQLSAAAAAAAAATSDPLTQAQIRSALLTSTASPIPPPVTTSSSAAVQAAVAAAAAAAAAQQATASPAMAGSLVHHHQKQLSTPLPLTSAGLSAAAAASAAGSGHPLAGQLPHPHHAQFKSISLNSTPTRNLTSLPYSSPALQHTMSPFAQGFYLKVHLNNAQKILGLYKIGRCFRIKVLILPCTMMDPAFYCRRRVTRRVARRRTPRPRRSWGHRAVPHPQRRHASA